MTTPTEVLLENGLRMDPKIFTNLYGHPVLLYCKGLGQLIDTALIALAQNWAEAEVRDSQSRAILDETEKRLDQAEARCKELVRHIDQMNESAR